DKKIMVLRLFVVRTIKVRLFFYFGLTDLFFIFAKLTVEKRKKRCFNVYGVNIVYIQYWD
ncbi:hypothetical protein, partial [Lederbergia ruris]|uniref:hypothetical protein n=1 Tax=Lederbergia ruris TaxID=217495 RepID=UPI00399F16FD